MRRMLRLAGVMLATGGMGGCVAAAPVGPDSSPEALQAACDASDLDACSILARRRSDGYEAAMRVK